METSTDFVSLSDSLPIKYDALSLKYGSNNVESTIIMDWSKSTAPGFPRTLNTPSALLPSQVLDANDITTPNGTLTTVSPTAPLALTSKKYDPAFLK